MAWTTMHFATGMAATAAVGVAYCVITRQRPTWLPLAMTIGGIWAMVPDLPRIWREDLPWLPFSAVLGQQSLERSLHSIGDVFFFHRLLDAQPHEYALHGLVLILVLYNAAIVAMTLGLRKERRRRRRLQAEVHGLVRRRQREGPQPMTRRAA